jgi:hypothetical protein
MKGALYCQFYYIPVCYEKQTVKAITQYMALDTHKIHETPIQIC